jgi:hypothetical protein
MWMKVAFARRPTIDWIYSQSCWYVPALLTVAPLPSLWLAPPPLPCVNKYTVYTYTVCKGGGVWDHRRGGLRQIKHLPQSPFIGKFF